MRLLYAAIIAAGLSLGATAQEPEGNAASPQTTPVGLAVEYITPKLPVRIQGFNPHKLPNGGPKSYTTTRFRHAGVIGNTGTLADLLNSGFVTTQLCGAKSGLTTAHCRENIVWYSRGSDDIEMRRAYCAGPFDENCSWVSHIFDYEVIEGDENRTYLLTYRESENKRPGLIGRWPLPDYSVEEAVAGALNVGGMVELTYGQNHTFAELRTSLANRGAGFNCKRNGWCSVTIESQGKPVKISFDETKNKSPNGITIWAEFESNHLVEDNRADLALAYSGLINTLSNQDVSDLNQWRAGLLPGAKTRQGLIINRRGDLAEVQSCLETRSIPGAPDQCIQSSVNWMNIEELVPQ